MIDASGTRKLLLMLAPHEPTLDPRIDWEASMAAETYDTTVLGLHAYYRTRTDEERRGNYWIRRATTWSPRDLWTVTRAMVRAAAPSMIARVLTWIIVSFAVVLGGSLFCLLRMLRWLYRGTAKLIRETFLRRYLLEPGRRCDMAFRDFVRRRHSPQLLSLLRFVYNVVSSSVLLWNLIRREPRTPALVHCNDLYSLLPGIAARQIYGCPVVYDSHEFWPYEDIMASRVQVACMKWYERSLARWADAIVTVSPQLAREIERTLRIPEVQVVPNAEPWRDNNVAAPSVGVAHSAHAGVSENTPTDGAAADHRVKFLFQGNFAPDRGIAELITAWRHVPADKAVLLLRGPVSPSRQQAEQLAESLGLLGRSILFPPAVSEDDLVAAAREADVGIIPYKPVHESYRYACPNKLSQYMHAGLAIVTNDLPYVKQMLAEGECGLAYDSSDEQSMCAVFSALIDDADLRERCRRNAREFARQEFNWQHFGKRFMEIYASLIDRGISGSPHTRDAAS